MFQELGGIESVREGVLDIVVNDYRKLYDNGTAIHFVAVFNSKIIAMSGAILKSDIPYRYFKVPFYGFIVDVYTDPKHRETGLATRLTKEVVGWLKSKGVTRIRLLASEAGRPIYEKLGFESSNEMILRCG